MARQHAGVASTKHGDDAFDAAVQADTEAGPLGVALTVNANNVGLVVDGPLVGRLKAVFELADDGTTGLGQLARTTPGGEEAPVRPMPAALEAEVRGLGERLAVAQATAEELTTDLQALRQAGGETGAQAATLRSELESVRAALELKSAEAERTQRALERARQELDGAKAAAGKERERHSAATVDAAARAAEARVKLEGKVKGLERDVEKLTGERDAALKSVSALEEGLAGLKAQLEAVVAESREKLDAGALELSNATSERDLALGEVKRLGAELEKEKKAGAELKAQLDEETARRDEMISDIAYIQTQVKDLSSTKGDLVSRLDTMAKREEKRRVSATEMSSMLRDAEVVAQDKLTSMRRIEAHSRKLETRVEELTRANVELTSEAEAAKVLRVQVEQLTKERDAMKVDINFFQKQVASLNKRAAQAAQPAPPRPKTLPPMPIAQAITSPELVVTQPAEVPTVADEDTFDLAELVGEDEK